MKIARGGGDHEQRRASHMQLFRNRDYLSWWVSGTASALGSSVSGIAYTLLMLAETGSSVDAGLVGSAGYIGSLVTMLTGGAIADRYSRRHVLMASLAIQVVAALVATCLVAFGWVDVWSFSAINIAQAVASGTAFSVGRSVVRKLVPEDQFPSAVSLMYSRTMGIRLVGPPLGGALFGFSRWIPFAGSVAAHFSSVLAVSAIHTSLDPTGAPDGGRTTFLQDLSAGVQYVYRNGYLRFVAIWTALVNAGAAGLLLIVVVLAQHRGANSFGVGLVTSIGAAGGILGSLFASRITRRLSVRAIFFGLSWAIPAACLLLALAPSPWAIGIALSALLFLVVPLNVVAETYEMRIVPDHFMGRVTNTVDFCGQAFRWTGPLMGGALALWVGPVTSAIIFAVLFAAIAVGVCLVPEIRALDSPITRMATEEGTTTHS